MRSFSSQFYDRVRLPPELVQTIRLLGEHKGREGLVAKVSPQVLEALRRAAIVESTESSNRIEGIVASRERIEQLVEGTTEPQNRSEQEIAGYREVLSTIHAHHDAIRLTPSVVLQLHRGYFLGVIGLGSYRELETRTDKVTRAPGAKSEMVRETIYRLPQRFRISDVLKLSPDISRPTVDRVIQQLREAGEIRLLKSGRYAEWTKTSTSSSSTSNVIIEPTHDDVEVAGNGDSG